MARRRLVAGRWLSFLSAVGATTSTASRSSSSKESQSNSYDSRLCCILSLIAALLSLSFRNRSRCHELQCDFIYVWYIMHQTYLHSASKVKVRWASNFVEFLPVDVRIKPRARDQTSLFPCRNKGGGALTPAARRPDYVVAVMGLPLCDVRSKSASLDRSILTTGEPSRSLKLGRGPCGR